MEFLTPFEIKGLRLKNRVVLPPMGTNFSADGEVTEKLINYYAERARGGVGLIIVESAVVEVPRGRVIKNQLSIHDDRLIPGLHRLASTVKAEGARVGIELAHSGRLAHSSITGMQPIAPSPIAAYNGDLPKELTIGEIKEIIKLFATAAWRAKEAGFDLIELHGAHGYLLGSFISPYTNKRKDEYGLEFKGRIKFPLDVVKAIREKIGEDVPLLYKLSGDEYIKGGITINDTIEIVRELAKNGVDCIDISATARLNEGDGVPDGLTNRPHSFYPDGCFVHIAREIKRAINIPVIICGKIYRPEQAEEILTKGYADLVNIGRAHIADPQWVNKTARKEWESVRMCLQCNIGCEGRIFSAQEMACTVNPYVGREIDLYKTPQVTPKKVVVVGGGPSGMEVARASAASGHWVTLLEKEKELGGLLDVASALPYKNYGRLSSYLIRELERLGVEVELNKEANMDTVIEMDPDVVVWAVGGEPIVPEIEGILDNPHVSTAVQVLRQDVSIGRKIIIIGGGMVGLETAEFLAGQGKKVIVLEKMMEVGSDIQPLTRRIILSNLQKERVILKTGIGIRRIEKNAIYLNEENEPLLGESIIIAVGFRPKKLPLGVRRQGDRMISFYAVGECAGPGRVLEAIVSGNKLGISI